MVPDPGLGLRRQGVRLKAHRSSEVEAALADGSAGTKA
jgi:hypothetical protein